MRVSFVLFVVLVSASFLTGCSNEPNPVGGRLVPGSDLLTIAIDTIDARSSSALRAYPAFNLSSRIVVGRSTLLQTEAWAWLKFNQLPDSLLPATFIEAHLELYGDYANGGSGALSFDLHEGLLDWHAPTQTTNDSLTLDLITPNTYYVSTPFSSYSGVVSPDTAKISVPLDTALVRKWFKASVDTATRNYGMVLKPTNADHIHGFVGFNSFSTTVRPKLVVLYRKSGSTIVDTARYSAGIDRFLTQFFGTTDDSTEIIVHSGYIRRGVVNFDNFVVPRNYGIHKAVLELTVKSSIGLSSYSRDSLFAYLLTPNGVNQSFASLSEKATVGSDIVYRIVITDFVRLWGELAPLRAVALAGLSEGNSVDIFRLHGHASSLISARPRLIISYTEFK